MSRMTNALIAWYKMNDNAASTTVIDSIAGNNGTYQTANTEDRTVPGKITSALSFTREHIALDSTINLTANWTVALWAKALVSSPSATLDSRLIGDNSEKKNQFYIVNNSKSYFSNDDGYGFEWTADVDFYNKWRFFVLIGTDTTIELFIDSISQGSQDLGGGAGAFNVADIASAHTTAATNFTGHIDNIMIFDIALTLNEIESLYNHGQGTENFSEVDIGNTRTRRCTLRTRYG